MVKASLRYGSPMTLFPAIFIPLFGLAPQFALSSTVTRDVPCAFNRIAISDHPASAAVWQDNNDNFLIRGNSPTGNSLIVIRYDGTIYKRTFPAEISALVWSKATQSYEFIVGGRQLASLRMSDLALSYELMNSGWETVRVRALLPYREKVLNNTSLASRIQSSLSQTDLQPTLFIGRGVSLFSISEKGGWSIKDIFSGRNYTSALGIRRLSKSPSYSRVYYEGHNASYELPLWDNTAIVTGSFSPSRIKFTRGGSIGSGGLIIKDATGSSAKGALLSSDSEGNHFFTTWTKGSRKTSVVCRPPGTTFPATRNHTTSIAKERFNAFYSRRLGIRSTAKRLIVYFHGGPWSSINDDFPSRAVRNISALPYDIISVDYPGSRGWHGVLGDRRITVAEMVFFNSILRDKIHRLGYSTWTVIGESFGALPAASFSSQYPQQVKDVILLSPINKLNIDTTLLGSPARPGSLQHSSELISFGTREQRRALSVWFDDRIRLMCKLNLTVVVGTDDKVTPAEGISNCMKSSIKILSGYSHSDISDSIATLID